MTEAQTEALLEEEVREIPLPDGTRRPVRGAKLMWQNYELVLRVDELQPQQIAAFAQEEVELQKLDFDRAFAVVVAYLSNKWHDFLEKLEEHADDLDEEAKRYFSDYFARINKAK